MSDLTHKDFAAFFRAVWGSDVGPFPWQEDLLGRLATGKDPRRGHAGGPGVWPAILDLPTGSGKTAALDIAVFHLALEADKREARRAPVRIAFVVDRRLIVDDAHTRAERLAEVLAWSLAGADDAARLEAELEAKRPHLVEVLRRIRAEPVVKAAAWRLGALAGAGQPPLVARRLRGGVPREDDWARTPVQPTILCSTVDQVGSRLLFRGYGVSDTMKPIHAGLLGSDCLILLDEAHLAKPFRQTLEAVKRLRGGDRERAPFGFAVLTATPPQDESQKEPPFGLSPADETHPILARRTAAAKPARLVEIANREGIGGEARRADEAARECVAVLARLRASGLDQPAVGVVVNRVARARGVFERLQAELGDEADIILLIGPARSVDRDDLAGRLELVRTRHPDAPRRLPKPLVVVATQTIEAGVDIDFDGLVTEAAALDALRQRFGRLNRAGRTIIGEAVILAHKADLATDDDTSPKADPVYGGRIKRTWAKLQQLAGEAGESVDFGIQALRKALDGGEADELSAPTANAPVLMPAYAHLWSQTAPIPNADPDVALFLHGPDRSPASVQIVWRADIDEEHDLQPAMEGPDAEAARARLVELLKLVPPRAAEAVQVPLWAARAWLDRPDDGQAGFADAAGRQPEQESDARQGAARRAFVWAGEDSDRTRCIYGRALRSGDLIVVPAGYGGCDRWGWNPGSRLPVADVADRAAEPYAARRLAVRVTPELARLELLAGSSDDVEELVESDLPARLRKVLADHCAERPERLLEATLALGLPPELTRRLETLRAHRRPRSGRPGRLEAYFAYGDVEDAPRGVVLIAPTGIDVGTASVDPAAAPSTESEDTGAASREPLSVAAHAQHVCAWAGAFASAAGLAPPIAEDVALAALLHDAGKADRRYQAYYAGGDPFGADASEPLAKTGQRRLPHGAWERAGLPPRWRHEALSVRLAKGHPKLEEAGDKLLVLWLIGTHHGHGRPMFPHADPEEGAEFGPQSLAFDLDGLDWARISDALKERYGIWGLARLEAFVRLADHRASEEGAAPGVPRERKEAAE